MEEYNKIYPELRKDKIYPEAPKDGKTFRLQKSCEVLEKLEKEAKHYTGVKKKYKRYWDILSRISTSTGTLSFCLSGSGVGTALTGFGLPLGASLGSLGLIFGILSVIAGATAKKVSRKVTKHEKTVSLCEAKINSIKDRISKALTDDKISEEEFSIILAEMNKFDELKQDIRRKYQKNKDASGARPEDLTELKRQIRSEILKKLVFEENRREAVPTSTNHLNSK